MPNPTLAEDIVMMYSKRQQRASILLNRLERYTKQAREDYTFATKIPAYTDAIQRLDDIIDYLEDMLGKDNL